MARAAIRELGQPHRIVSKSRSVTVQTPTHIHDLGVPGNIDIAHIPMTIFAVQARRDMRPMGEVYKVRHLGDRHPGDFFIVQNIIFENGQFGTGVGDLHLLVTAPAFCKRRQPGRRSA